MISVLLVVSSISVISLWASFCVYRTNKEVEKLHHMALLNNGSLTSDQLSWCWQEEQHSDLLRHVWRRMTFRNPWVTWGPITISIVYDYDMNKGDFWDYYKYVYRQGWIGKSNKRRKVCKKMVEYGWRHTGPTACSHPMSSIMHCQYDIRLGDWMPNPQDYLMQGYEEYQEIMNMQEAAERR